MRKLFIFTLVGAAMTASTALGATIVTYSSAASFNASTIVGGSATVTEDFNTNDSLFTSFEVQGAAGLIPGFGGGETPATLFPGQRTTRVTGAYSEVITLDAGNMTAFGGTWNLSPFSGLGAGIKITIALLGGGTQVLTPILGYGGFGDGTTPFFFGFTSDVAFTSVMLSQGGQSGVTYEGFNLDDMLVEQAAVVEVEEQEVPPSAVPEPSSFGLMGIAMVGLGLVRRFRR